MIAVPEALAFIQRLKLFSRMVHRLNANRAGPSARYESQTLINWIMSKDVHPKKATRDGGLSFIVPQ